MSKKRKNKDKKIKNILKNLVSFVVSLTTVAASIATCVTLLEMRKERNQAYKPYFIIEKSTYNEKLEKSIFNLSNTNNLVHTLLMKKNDFIPMTIKIDNIGAGTATNIKIEYSYSEYKKYWETVCDYYGDEIDITDNELRVKYYLSSDEKMYEYKHNMNTSDLIIDKPYVFFGENLEIPIPEEYLRLFYSIAYCTNGNCGELPEIELKIEYNDLQGITYYKSFKLGIDIHVEINSDESLNDVEYIIEQSK